ncbi:motility protein A [Candidatus Galacturonibacter soehngenii]|uniref:Motility protein A n=1 Tax=Candidatus Galacturonatibacter soehngenii TaxID=2307010 RepID=A0A7V7QK33_9FIRM|nr:motility protein A [Candidatus Galacturonibacter soehngenii]KAB1437701.1 motility protein A [Candidatus Galacturonibacter soehngenii]MBA4686932.1 motility protein A [Candidatus Galacturonibacter soehngenii]
MDIASIIGLFGCFFIIIFGIVTGNLGFAALPNFWDLPSIIITIGGTFVCVMASVSMKDFIAGLSSIRLVFKSPTGDEAGTIRTIIDLSNVARKEGLLSLEEAANNLEDEFLKKGILLIVDGTDPELVRAILETELSCIEARHKKTISFWETVGAMGPAWGMIGTLIGLINMLKVLADSASIGPNMATALVTTFYGSVLANWISAPVASKLKVNNSIEIMLKEVIIEGLLSIQAGENPRVIEEKLKSFLSPKQRIEFSAASGEETLATSGGGEN